MKIKSFGCSFIYGSDLEDSEIEVIDPGIGYFPSKLTWPALLATRLGLDYECYAIPGQGNFKILCDIVSQGSLDDKSLMLINWTWIDRYDYLDDREQWNTLRPSENSELEKFYYRNLHSQYQDLLKSIYYINTAIDFLNEKNYPFVMSFMDNNLLTPINPDWHDPRCLEVIQTKISKHLTTFEGMNFLDWSQHCGFSISKTWHPLEEAHVGAADYMFGLVKHKLDKLTTNTL